MNTYSVAVTVLSLVGWGLAAYYRRKYWHLDAQLHRAVEGLEYLTEAASMSGCPPAKHQGKHRRTMWD